MVVLKPNGTTTNKIQVTNSSIDENSSGFVTVSDCTTKLN